MVKRAEAFSYIQWMHVDQSIKEAKTRALTHLRHGHSGRELFDSFVKDEHKDALTSVFKICDIKVEHQSFEYELMLKSIEVEGLTLDIKANFAIALHSEAEFKFLFPKYFQKKGSLAKASEGLQEMFRLVATVNFEWARVWQVLSSLQTQCSSPAQVKTVCPHLAALLQDATNDGAKDLGKRLSKMRDSSTLPALSLELRQQALHIGQTITKGLLIPETSEAPADDFLVTMTSGSTNKKHWNDKTWGVIIA